MAAAAAVSSLVGSGKEARWLSGSLKPAAASYGGRASGHRYGRPI